MTTAQRGTAETLLARLLPTSHFFRWSPTGDERVVMVATGDDGSRTLAWIERDGTLVHLVEWGQRDPQPDNPAFAWG